MNIRPMMRAWDMFHTSSRRLGEPELRWNEFPISFCNLHVPACRMTRRDRRKARHAKYAWQAGMSGLALIQLLAACAHAQSVAPPPPAQMSTSIPAEPELRERVAKWWTARQQRDHALMYELYEPAYRERVDMRSFLQESLIRSRFDIASHSIQQITPEDGAKARVKLELAIPWPRSATPYATTLEESWIRVNGHWYKMYQPPQLPFPANRLQ